jgi:phosphate transport system protein
VVVDPPEPESDVVEVEVRELRRPYHDRIAELRAKTISILEDASHATEDATKALLEQDHAVGEKIAALASETSGRVGDVDAEVLALLALQAPVARDLRMILASRDIAQTGDLCMGLCLTLGTRVEFARDVLSLEMKDMVSEIGAGTADLLLQANGAWTTLDEGQSHAVAASARECRQLQRQFLAALVRLQGVPVEAAVDLGMAARVYERLTDHSLEIAARALFAINGMPTSQARHIDDL